MANLNERSFPKGIREIRYPSNDLIQRFTSKDYTGTLKLNNETGLFEFDPPLEGTGASSGTTFAVNQVGHGFTVGQPIYHNGASFALANSSSEDTLAMWVVTNVTNEDNFTAAQSGRFEIEDGHGLITNQFYFVGDTDGSLTPTEPSTYSNPVLYIESPTVFHVLPFRPSSPNEGGSGGSGGVVTSVFGRVGAVSAQSGDYTKDQVGLGNVLNVEQIPTTEKGANNGVATLDGSGKVPASQLPVAVEGGINILGFWDADTNNPNIGTLTLNNGDAYQVSVAGSTNLNGITTWNQYDLAVWSNDITGNWFRVASSANVISVNGQTGAVVLGTDEVTEGSSNLYYTEARVSANTNVAANTAKVSAGGSINTHSDVDTSSVAPTSGQALTWDGFNWTPGDIVAGVSSVNGQSGVVVLDADDISDTSTTNKWFSTTERTKLDGIEANAEVNNISDANATELTGLGSTTLHSHAFDRDRANHTGTQVASTISDFDTAVSSNASVAANTAKVSANASINTHSDVDTNSSTPTNGQVLGWNGTYWVPNTITGTLPGGVQGDILYNDGAGWLTLSAGTAGYVLSTNGIGANPSWIESGGGASSWEQLTDVTTKTGNSKKIAKVSDDENTIEYTTYDHDQVVNVSDIDLSDINVGESKILIATKEASGDPSFGGALSQLDKLGVPALSSLLAETAAWDGDEITLTGNNLTGGLGENSQEYYIGSDFFLCISHSNGTTTSNGTATWRRNRGQDSLTPGLTNDDAIIAELETSTGWSSLPANFKTITSKSKQGTWYRSSAGGYLYLCINKTNGWVRVGDPDTIDLEITSTSHPVLTASLAAHTWTTLYLEGTNASDEPAEQGQEWWDISNNSVYKRGMNNYWAKIF